MHQFETSPNWPKNRDRHGERDAFPCIVCGKAVPSARAKYVRVWWGTTAVTADEAQELEQSDPGGDTGLLPIGADCLRKQPELRAYIEAQS